jgi:hypothetical protein
MKMLFTMTMTIALAAPGFVTAARAAMAIDSLTGPVTQNEIGLTNSTIHAMEPFGQCLG